MNAIVKAAVKASLKKKKKASKAPEGQEKDDLYNFDGLAINNQESSDSNSD